MNRSHAAHFSPSIFRPLAFRVYIDGMGSTLFIVENVDAGVHWMEPRDLSFDAMSFTIAGGETNAAEWLNPITDGRTRPKAKSFPCGGSGRKMNRSHAAHFSPSIFRPLVFKDL